MDFLNELRELRNSMANLSGEHLGPGGQYQQAYEAGAKSAAEILDRHIQALEQDTSDAERARLDSLSLMMQRNAWRSALIGLCDKETYSPLEAAQFVKTRIRNLLKKADADSDGVLLDIPAFLRHGDD